MMSSLPPTHAKRGVRACRCHVECRPEELEEADLQLVTEAEARSIIVNSPLDASLLEAVIEYVFDERHADVLPPMLRTADHPILAQDGLQVSIGITELVCREYGRPWSM